MSLAGVFYPLEDLPDVQRRWRDYVTTAPDEVTAFMVALTFPAAPDMPKIIHDRQVTIVAGVHCGNPDEGMQVLQPLRELSTPLFDMSQPMPYTALQSGFDALFARQALRSYWKSTYLDELTDDAIDTIARKALDRPAPLTGMAVLEPVGKWLRCLLIRCGRYGAGLSPSGMGWRARCCAG